MKKIVLVNQDSGYLMIDIANALSARDFDISLITGRLVVRNKPLYESVKVVKIIKYSRYSTYRRLISWLIAFFQIVVILKTKYRKEYLFLFTNPPVSTFLPLLFKNRFSMMVFDVFPDAITQMGLLSENSFFIRFWKLVNKKVFSRAENVFTITENMALRLQEYRSRGKIRIVPVWSDNSFFKPIPKSLNPFVIEHNLSKKFVILYSGNLGATHNVEIIPEVASNIDNPDVVFVIIGEGDRRQWLEVEVQRRSLRNCLILSLQPVEKMNFSFASADIAIVTLGIKASGLSLPSKTFNYISAGLPLLCIASGDSELNKLTTKYNNGKCFAPDQIDKIVSFIHEMTNNRELHELFRTNSYKASGDFTPQNAELIAETICKSIESN